MAWSKEKQLAYMRIYYANNREKILEVVHHKRAKPQGMTA